MKLNHKILAYDEGNPLRYLSIRSSFASKAPVENVLMTSCAPFAALCAAYTEVSDLVMTMV